MKLLYDSTVEITGAQKRAIKQVERQKPYQQTILKRSTLRNLEYLAERGLIKPFDRSHFVVPVSSRQRLDDGTIFADRSPKHGV